MVEENDKIIDDMEVAVLFKREILLRNNQVIYKPFKVIKGSLSYLEEIFVDEEGNPYHHLCHNMPGNSFAYRRSLLELEMKYNTQDFEIIATKYLEEIDKFYYYIIVWPELNLIDVTKEDKITHKLTSLDDEYSKQFKDSLIVNDEEVEEVSNETTIIDETSSSSELTFNTHKLVSDVKKKVIAQDTAIETIVANIWNNTKLKDNHNNMLIIGPTGTGKTEIFRRIAEKLDIPFYQTSMASYSKSGYFGDSVIDILEGLILACDNDVAKAERAIVFLDEIDKIANYTKSKDNITNTGVQDELLKIMEDGTYTAKIGNEIYGNKVVINTKNITFIGAGAFDGILEMVKEKHIGFGKKLETSELNNYHEITNEHLIEYGFKPEIVGRMPIIIVLDKLTKEDLITIMKSSENNILEEQIRVINDEGIEVVINDDIYEAIAEEAIRKNIGARGLNTVINKLFSRILYEISNPDVRYDYLEITKETLKDPSKYVLINKKQGKIKTLRKNRNII